MHIVSSRQFNQSVGKAQRAANTAPVFITNRGKTAYVLMSKAEYDRLTQNQPKTLAQWYAQAAPEVADVDLPIEPRSTAARADVDWSE